VKKHPAQPTEASVDLEADRIGSPGLDAEASAEEPPATTGGEDRESAAESAGAAPDYKDRWLRAEADLQNYRRRATREWEDARRIAEESVFLEIIGALDDLDRAALSAAEQGASASWAQGVGLVAQRLRDYLARQGVREIDPLGQAFDPNLHEALIEVDAPEGARPGSVVQVVQKGYARGDRALRAARVVVARANGVA
jgi:molecular chaperone GrpE